MYSILAPKVVKKPVKNKTNKKQNPIQSHFFI